MAASIHESRALGALRDDALLPKLISGELRGQYIQELVKDSA